MLYVHPQGLEPRTPCLEGRCSIQLSYECITLFNTDQIRLPRILLAERGGFEPPVRFLARMFSKHVVSATHPPLQAD